MPGAARRRLQLMRRRYAAAALRQAAHKCRDLRHKSVTPLAKHAGSFYEELLQRLRELSFLAVKSLRFDSENVAVSQGAVSKCGIVWEFG